MSLIHEKNVPATGSLLARLIEVSGSVNSLRTVSFPQTLSQKPARRACTQTTRSASTASGSLRIKKKIYDPGRTRTCNPLIRSQMPCPLGHRAVVNWLWNTLLNIVRIMHSQVWCRQLQAVALRQSILSGYICFLWSCFMSGLGSGLVLSSD